VVRIAGLAAVAVGVVMALGQSAGHAQLSHAAPNASLTAAATSVTFVDPTGDNPAAAPDITTVQFSNDDSGRFEVRVTLANRTDLSDQDFVNLQLETDQGASLGCDLGGFRVDYILGVVGRPSPTPDLFSVMRCLTNDVDRFTPQRSLIGEYDAATSSAVWHFGCAEIGRPHSLRLAVFALHGDPQNDPGGIVSDSSGPTPWLYDVVPPCGPDTTPPRVAAIASIGVRGTKAKLAYRVADDSGYTKEAFAIYRGKRRLVHTSSLSFANADAAETYFASWPVPRHVAKKLRFCVSAVDEAKNRSGTSCAPLTIR
jgi:hypothetical protein